MTHAVCRPRAKRDRKITRPAVEAARRGRTDDGRRVRRQKMHLSHWAQKDPEAVALDMRPQVVERLLVV